MLSRASYRRSEITCSIHTWAMIDPGSRNIVRYKSSSDIDWAWHVFTNGVGLAKCQLRHQVKRNRCDHGIGATICSHCAELNVVSSAYMETMYGILQCGRVIITRYRIGIIKDPCVIRDRLSIRCSYVTSELHITCNI